MRIHLHLLPRSQHNPRRTRNNNQKNSDNRTRDDAAKPERARPLLGLRMVLCPHPRRIAAIDGVMAITRVGKAPPIVCSSRLASRHGLPTARLLARARDGVHIHCQLINLTTMLFHPS